MYTYLILVRISHDIEEQIDITLVDTGEAIQHDNFCIGSVSLVEQVLFEGFSLLDGGKGLDVVIFGQDPVPIAVQNNDAFDGVQGGFLKRPLYLPRINQANDLPEGTLPYFETKQSGGSNTYTNQLRIITFFSL